MRADLLALSDDDLAGYANRGVVRRARRHADAGEGPSLQAAADGTLTASAPDGTVTVLPGDRTLEHVRCTCAAAGVCRHAVALVLAAQAQPPAAAEPGDPDTVGDQRVAAAPWDPGAIDDEQLAAAGSRRVLTAAKTRLERGQTWTLVRAAKPLAELLDEGISVRFLVAGDVRYARCDCPDPAPCAHAVGAALAFRLLGTDLNAATIETVTDTGPSDTERAALDELESALGVLAEAGAGAPAVPALLRRAGTTCAAAGLSWPADVAAELAGTCDAWSRSDATFGDADLARLAGEALARTDTLRAATGAVPRLLVAGPAAATPQPVRGARLIGLGCSARPLRHGVELCAHLADTGSGQLLALVRRFADPDPGDEPPPYARLATSSRSGVTLADAGRGQIVATGGKRLPTGVLDLGRKPSSVIPQRFMFDEVLHPSILTEDIAEAAARAVAEVPAAVGARGPGRGLMVLPVAHVRDSGFSPATQEVVILAEDTTGRTFTVRQRYTSRAAGGIDALLAALDGPERLRWVAGTAVAGAELELQPTGLVFEDDSGARRMVQPWVDPGPAERAAARAPDESASPTENPVGEWIAELQEALGALLIGGVSRADAAAANRWRDIVGTLDALGSVHLAVPTSRLSEALDRRRRDLDWQPDIAIAATLELLALTELARGL